VVRKVLPLMLKSAIPSVPAMPVLHGSLEGVALNRQVLWAARRSRPGCRGKALRRMLFRIAAPIGGHGGNRPAVGGWVVAVDGETLEGYAIWPPSAPLRRQHLHPRHLLIVVTAAPPVERRVRLALLR
jgi:hypothetical protein